MVCTGLSCQKSIGIGIPPSINLWSRYHLPFSYDSSDYWKWYFGYEVYWIHWWFGPYNLYWIDPHIGHC